jgi:single-stranded-DNA-specific exonuclease
MITYRWVEKSNLPVSQEIHDNFRNPWVQQILTRNNIHTIESAKQFLDSTFYKPTPASDLPDLEIAANRILKAINDNELIGIWGDFDVDGQTATTLLFESLKKLGANVIFYIPIRAKESHGIRLDSLKEFLKNEISILLTCDTGISENESVAYAKCQGIDVLITDHHSLPEKLPEAMALVNPQRLPTDHPLRTLSGVGVAYKLVEHLYKLTNRTEECYQFLDLVAMGTIADVAILTGDNRYLVQSGLKILQNPVRTGLQEIYKNKKFVNGEITEYHISFYLAPLLNALGRLSDANPIVEFLTTDDVQKAKVFSIQLENINERRKLITEQITDAIISKIEQNNELIDDPAIVMHHSDWEAGVLGIVANRLVEIYHKPTFLLTGTQETGYFGSARSIENLNIIEAITANSKFLKHFGGHAMAAGISLQPENLQMFKNGLNKHILDTMGDSILQKELLIDGFINFDLINFDFVKELEKLSPFGPGNPAPIFASKNVVIEILRKIGKKSEHLKFTASDSQENFQEFLWWRGGLDQIPDDKVDLAFNVHSTNFQGKQKIQIEIITIRPSETIIQKLKSNEESIAVSDFRVNEPVDSNWINQYNQIVWYQEGLEKNYSPTFNRKNLLPAETLIIFTIPPNLTELRKVYYTVMPNNLILFGNFPIERSINGLIKIIAGMLIHTIKNKNGLFQPNDLAIATGQRPGIIEAICRYLNAIGQISLTEHPDTQWHVKLAGIKNNENANFYKQQIDFLHKETLAFQKWYLETGLENLKNAIYNYQI